MSSPNTLIIKSNTFLRHGLEILLGNMPPFYIPIGGKELFRYYQDCDFERVIIVFPEKWQVSEFELDFFKSNNFDVHYAIDFFGFLDVEAKKHKSLSILLEPAMLSDLINRDTNILLSKNSFVSDVMDHQHAGKRYSLSFLKMVIDPDVECMKTAMKRAALNELISESRSDIFSESLVMNDNSSFYRERIKFLSARNFNSLTYHNGYIKKSSEEDKLLHEVKWLLSIPSHLKEYIPNVIYDSGRLDYRVQYIAALSLSEIIMLPDYTHIDFPRVIEEIGDFLCAAIITDQCTYADTRAFQARLLFSTKLAYRKTQTLDQLNLTDRCILTVNGVRMSSFREIEASIERVVDSSHFISNIMHGDLCFSNIIYDQVLNKIYLIDPRGTVNEQDSTLYGVLEYDIVKLLHSVIGFYDLIVFNKYELTQCSKHEYLFYIKNDVEMIGLHNIVYNIFKEKKLESSFNTAVKLLPSLFLSMIPLHSDDPKRQMALYIRGLQLYKLYGKK